MPCEEDALGQQRRKGRGIFDPHSISRVHWVVTSAASSVLGRVGHYAFGSDRVEEPRKGTAYRGFG